MPVMVQMEVELPTTIDPTRTLHRSRVTHPRSTTVVSRPPPPQERRAS